MQRRRTLLDRPEVPSIDWATAEVLAFASILADGIAIRLTGEDAARGTFSQRHTVFHDVQTGATFPPLQALPQARAAFETQDSPLTENATVGFEYGYNIQSQGAWCSGKCSMAISSTAHRSSSGKGQNCSTQAMALDGLCWRE